MWENTEEHGGPAHTTQSLPQDGLNGAQFGTVANSRDHVKVVLAQRAVRDISEQAVDSVSLDGPDHPRYNSMTRPLLANDEVAGFVCPHHRKHLGHPKGLYPKVGCNGSELFQEVEKRDIPETIHSD